MAMRRFCRVRRSMHSRARRTLLKKAFSGKLCNCLSTRAPKMRYPRTDCRSQRPIALATSVKLKSLIRLSITTTMLTQLIYPPSKKRKTVSSSQNIALKKHLTNLKKRKEFLLRRVICRKFTMT